MDPNLHRPMALQETPVILPGHDFETVTETIAEIPLSRRYPLGWIGFIAVALFLLAVALIATLIPARSSTRIDPVVALRVDG